MGTLIWEIFNGSGATSASSYRQLGLIPRPLSAAYGELVNPNPAHRSSLDKLLQSPFIEDNALVECLLFLEQIQVSCSRWFLDNEFSFFASWKIPPRSKHSSMPYLTKSMNFPCISTNRNSCRCCSMPTSSARRARRSCPLSSNSVNDCRTLITRNESFRSSRSYSLRPIEWLVFVFFNR